MTHLRTTTHELETDGATITYDVRTPAEPGRHPTLVVLGQPMTADGFAALAEQLDDRTVVTYDPRGLGRSRRSDGLVTQDPVQQAGDVHALVEALGGGPVDVFGSSGGAVTGLALVEHHPGDVRTLVAHEPPLVTLLPDADAAQHAFAAVDEAYAAKGFGWGMAGFIRLVSWEGEFDDRYFAQPTPDPAQFGLPTQDDGSRDDELLSDRAKAVTQHRPDPEALRRSGTRVVLGVGAESRPSFTGRTGDATAALLGQQAVVFPSHHGGFSAADGPYPGQPEAFAAVLREVLDGDRG